MLTLSKYQVNFTLHEGVETIIYRAQTPTDGHATILKVLKADQARISNSPKFRQRTNRQSHQYRNL
jgi:histidine kinase